MIVFRLGPKRSRSTATDQLLAVAGSCLPMSFVRDNSIKCWVNYIAPEVPPLKLFLHITNLSFQYKLPHAFQVSESAPDTVPDADNNIAFVLPGE